jgi:hypothetical protein
LPPEKKILKDIYSEPCFVFQLDTLKSFDRLINFARREYQTHPDSCLYVGYKYNLADSSFVPSSNESMNCVIPCGFAGPLILKYAPSNVFYISKIKDDSLNIEYISVAAQRRIHIGELKGYFDYYLNKILHGYKLSGITPIRIGIDISDNPSKDLFIKIFNLTFWSCYDECFDILKHYQNIDIVKLSEDPKADFFELFGYHCPIAIMFSDSAVSPDKRIPILVNI